MRRQPNTIYSTMAHCAAATNTSKSVLRLAKAQGAPGFIGYRIDWTELEPWLNEHRQELEEQADDSILKWKTKRARADALKAEIELDEMRKMYLIRSEVEAQVKAIALAQKNILKAKLCNELPPRLLGLNTTEISVEMEKVLREICQLMENIKL